MKGDHRILADSAFVIEVFAEAEEKFDMTLMQQRSRFARLSA
jgi:hypothetical protein